MKSNNHGEIGTIMVIMMVVMLGAGLFFGKKSGMMGMCGMSHEEHKEEEHKNHLTTEGKDKQMINNAIDPVCGMTVEISSITFNTVLDGTTYYFCSSPDKNKFDLEPAKYIKK